MLLKSSQVGKAVSMVKASEPSKVWQCCSVFLSGSAPANDSHHLQGTWESGGSTEGSERSRRGEGRSGGGVYDYHYIPVLVSSTDSRLALWRFLFSSVCPIVLVSLVNVFVAWKQVLDLFSLKIAWFFHTSI